MTSINGATPNTKTSAGYSSKGMSGMVSGMDTDAVVEAMTSDIQAKIDKIKQDQQKYDWKQDAYREAITSLINFQDKYFSYSSSKNLFSSNIFNCTAMVPGGINAGKISMNGSSGTATSTYSITEISQIARKAGFTSGGSKTSAAIKTGDISFGDRETSVVAGGSVKIKYGSETYTVDIPRDAKPKTAQELVDVLNTAMENNPAASSGNLSDKLKFSADADGKMSLSFTDSADTNSFSIEGGSTAALKALHMTAGDEGTSGSIVASEATVADDLLKTVNFDLTGKELTFEYNGSSKTISFTAEDSTAATDIDALALLIQGKIDAKFGEDKIQVQIPTDTSQLEFITVKPDGNGGIAYDDTSLLKLSSKTADTLGDTGIFKMENGAKNRLDTAKKLKDLGFTPSDKTDPDAPNEYKFKVNGVEFTFGDDDTMASVISKMNNDPDAGVTVTFLSTSGRFSVTADEFGAQGKVDFQDLGIADPNGVGIIEGLFGGNGVIDTDTNGGVTKGLDMKMKIRYEGSNADVEVTRSNNTANIDGVNFTATGTFSAYETKQVLNPDGTPKVDGEGNPVMEQVYNPENAISFTSKADTENLINTIKEMAEDYNKILDDVNKMTSTKGNKDYKPLTDAQRKEMTTDEIKVWEDKAKEGVMFGDSTLEQLASDMRFLFSAAVGDVGAPNSIGISTSSSYSDNGKIKIDEKKLKEALETNPEKVKAMFTSSKEESPGSGGNKIFDGGLAIRMQSVMEAYAKDKGSQKGKLVDLAGIKNNPTTENNYIARQQKILSNNLKHFQDVLKKRRDRYQGQFTNLEVYISKMNAQSSWLQQAGGQ